MELALKRKMQLPTLQKFSDNFSKSEEINKKLFVLQIFSPVFVVHFLYQIDISFKMSRINT